MAANNNNGTHLSEPNPKFFYTNSTSHMGPFSAVAELIDNAYNHGLEDKELHIDIKIIRNETCLTFTDNGKGMTLDKLHMMLGDNVMGHVPIGLYGHGFKSGSMRLGKDAIVFTRNKSGMHVGMLSQSYLEKINAEHVLVPIISFDQQGQLVQTPDSEANLKAITTYSLLKSKRELLEELETIANPNGTNIIIWNLSRGNFGHPEFDFDFDNDDMVLTSRITQTAHESDYSLRAYCSILYLKPRLRISLREEEIKTQVVTRHLAYKEKDVCRPQCLAPTTIKITFGYKRHDKEHYGLMMYHKNRLIKAYKRVGCQLEGNNQGVGVIGVVECDFLKLTHNKQDFDDTNEYRLTLYELGLKLSEYWNKLKVKKNSDSRSRPVEDKHKHPLSNEDTPAKKQKLSGSEMTDILQLSNDDGNITKRKDNTAQPENNHKKSDTKTLKGSAVVSTSHSVPTCKAVATQTKRATLTIKKEEYGGYDCSKQEDQKMPGSHQGQHQESSVDTTDNEEESLKIYCEKLLLRVKGLEEEIIELRSNQIKIEVSHQKTQTEVSPPNEAEFALKQLVAQYEQNRKEIKRLKEEYDVLLNIKSEPDTVA